MLPAFDYPGEGILNRFDLSCPTSTSCFVLSFFDGSSTSFRTLMERWDGTTWTELPVPDLDGASLSLTGVSCVSPTSCFAVGSKYSDQMHTLAERWDGTTWSVVPSPDAAGAEWSQLRDVSCVSAANCLAVGGSSNDLASSQYQPLAERWDGNTWSIVPSANPGAGVLAKVSCVTETACVASGESETTAYRPFLERWDGTSWSTTAFPVPSGGSSLSLTGVGCASGTTCFVVGNSYQAGVQQGLLERWDGAKWSIVAIPPATGAFSNLLSDVSCAPGASCFAVGSYGTHVTGLSSDSYWTLAERYS